MFNKATFIFALLILCLALSAWAQSPVHDWSQRFGDSDNEYSEGMAVDPDGNIVLGGRYQGTINFGGDTLVNQGQDDFFVAKFDPDGNHIWSRSFGGADNEGLVDLAVDMDGNIILTGYYTGESDFGGGILPHIPGFLNYDLFLVMLDPSGNHLWSQGFGDSEDQLAYSLATDNNNDIVLTGTFGGVVDFGAGPIMGQDQFDIFLAKFSQSGTNLWSQSFGGTRGIDVSVDNYDKIALVGFFFNEVDFGGGPIVGSGGSDICVARFNPNGSHMWSRGFGDSEGQFASTVVQDHMGNVYISGGFTGELDFGGGIVENEKSYNDIFLAGFDPTGTHRWSTSFGSSSNVGQQSADLAISPQGVLMLTGSFRETVDFGGGPLINGPYAKVYVTGYSLQGNHLWSVGYGSGAGHQYGRHCAFDASGNSLVAGYFHDEIDFGGGPLVSSGLNDIYLAKFSNSVIGAEVGDFVWWDENANGIQDPGEPGYGNGYVQLFDTNDNLIAWTSSNVGPGQYLFTHVYPGDYYLTFQGLADDAISPWDVGEDDFDSDMNGDLGRTAIFTLTAGQVDHSWDCGFYNDPICDVSPTSLDFGSVFLGRDQEIQFTITNAGSGTLTGSVTETCDHYDLVSGAGPYSLTNGQSVTVTVRFEPTAVGIHDCTIETGGMGCPAVICMGEGWDCSSVGPVMYVDATAPSGGDGSSWAEAFNELHEALEMVGPTTCSLEIWVARGTYTPTYHPLYVYQSFNLRSGLAIFGGFTGVETSRNQRNIAANPTVLSGDVDNNGNLVDNINYVVRSSGADMTAILDGFKITGGYHGSGVYNSNGSTPIIRNVEIVRNYAGNEGGGGMWNDASSPLLENVVIADNFSEYDGGGMMNTNGSHPSLVNVVFHYNETYGFSFSNLGGGMCNEGGSDPLIVNCSFTYNYADGHGCGIYNGGSSPVLINTILWDDEFEDQIYNAGGTPVISHSLIYGCGGSGGGWDSAFGIDGGNNLDADPGFEDMWGGDLHLTVGSPAIDSGDNTAPGLPDVDLDGYFRIVNGVVDMGAYEFGSEPAFVDEDEDGTLPQTFALHRAFPNPFNPITTIRFDLPGSETVSLRIFDLSGRLVNTLVDGMQLEPGEHSITWNGLESSGKKVAAGVYFYRLEAGKFRETKSMTLLK